MLGKYTIRQLERDTPLWAMYSAQHAEEPSRRCAVFRFVHSGVLQARQSQAFLREIEVLATRRHSGLPAIAAVGLDRNTPTVVTAALPTETLADRLAMQGALPLGAVSAMLVEVAGALDALHAERPVIAFRKLEPARILWIPGGTHALLLGAGFEHALRASRLEIDGQSLRTPPQYRSPEEDVTAWPLSAAMDQFALAAVVHECLTGAAPFSTDEEQSLREARSIVRPPVTESRPELPFEVDAVLRRAYSPQPLRRYNSCGAFAAEFARVAAAARAEQRPVAAPRAQIRTLRPGGMPPSVRPPAREDPTEPFERSALSFAPAEAPAPTAAPAAPPPLPASNIATRPYRAILDAPRAQSTRTPSGRPRDQVPSDEGEATSPDVVAALEANRAAAEALEHRAELARDRSDLAAARSAALAAIVDATPAPTRAPAAAPAAAAEGFASAVAAPSPPVAQPPAPTAAPEPPPVAPPPTAAPVAPPPTAAPTAPSLTAAPVAPPPTAAPVAPPPASPAPAASAPVPRVASVAPAALEPPLAAPALPARPIAASPNGRTRTLVIGAVFALAVPVAASAWFAHRRAASTPPAAVAQAPATPPSRPVVEPPPRPTPAVPAVPAARLVPASTPPGVIAPVPAAPDSPSRVMPPSPPVAAVAPPGDPTHPMLDHPTNEQRQAARDAIAASFARCVSQYGRTSERIYFEVSYQGASGRLLGLWWGGAGFARRPITPCLLDGIRGVSLPPFRDERWVTRYSFLVD